MSCLPSWGRGHHISWAWSLHQFGGVAWRPFLGRDLRIFSHLGGVVLALSGGVACEMSAILGALSLCRFWGVVSKVSAILGACPECHFWGVVCDFSAILGAWSLHLWGRGLGSGGHFEGGVVRGKSAIFVGVVTAFLGDVQAVSHLGGGVALMPFLGCGQRVVGHLGGRGPGAPAAILVGVARLRRPPRGRPCAGSRCHRSAPASGNPPSSSGAAEQPIGSPGAARPRPRRRR